MPRIPGTDRNAEAAVQQFLAEMERRRYGPSEAWKAVSLLLMTCEIWARGWQEHHGEPILRDSNDYALDTNGKPNKALQED
jgi:hypothetical protein